jgi:hypothetical protein
MDALDPSCFAAAAAPLELGWSRIREPTSVRLGSARKTLRLHRGAASPSVPAQEAAREPSEPSKSSRRSASSRGRAAPRCQDPDWIWRAGINKNNNLERFGIKTR